jgi:hypothetical protein
MDKVKRSTLTEKQIKAKLSSLLYSFEEGDIGYDLLDGGYIESDAEGTELEPYVRNAKSAHEAFKLAEANKDKMEKNWDDISLFVASAMTTFFPGSPSDKFEISSNSTLKFLNSNALLISLAANLCCGMLKS